MRRKFLFFTLVFTCSVLLPYTIEAQENNDFTLSVSVNNYPDSMNNVLLLGRYYGNSQFILDTAKYNPKTNKYVFSSATPKEGGLYLLISADKRYTEFIIDQNQDFSIETSFPNLSGDIKFTNSEENKIYVDFAEEGSKDYKRMNELQAAFKKAKESKDTIEEVKLREEIVAVYKIFEQNKTDFINEHPKHLMAALFKAQKDVNVPDAPDSLSDDDKRLWQYEYYKNNYFDNFDLCDDRLLRTPIFHQYLESFLEETLYMQSPDTIKIAIERLIEKARCSKELFKYIIWYTVDKYQRSEIIGHDAIWVYLADKYYTTGEAFWASASIIENFAKRIKRVKPLLIGSVPPEFSCPDTTVDSKDENFISVFSSPKKYTVIIFWSMDCGHCKTSMPKWLEFYHTTAKELDVEIISICKDFEVDQWKKFIRDGKYDWIDLNGKTATADYNDLWDIQTTPVVYIIDRDKRIVTKRIDVEHAEDFIRAWERQYYPE